MARDRDMFLGAVAGTLATLPMSALMLAARRAGWLTEQAPERITQRSIERSTARAIDDTSLDVATGFAHLAFGASAGALFAVATGGRRSNVSTAGALGVGYGLLVWLVAYGEVLPALRLMPPASRDQRGRPQTMILAHVVYGGTLGALSAMLDRSRLAAARD